MQFSMGNLTEFRVPTCYCECEDSASLASALLLLPCALPSAQAHLFLLHCRLPKRELPLLCGCSVLGTVVPHAQQRLSAPAIIILTNYYCCHCWGKRKCNLGVLTKWPSLLCPVIERDNESKEIRYGTVELICLSGPRTIVS